MENYENKEHNKITENSTFTDLAKEMGFDLKGIYVGSKGISASQQKIEKRTYEEKKDDFRHEKKEDDNFDREIDHDEW